MCFKQRSDSNERRPQKDKEHYIQRKALVVQMDSIAFSFCTLHVPSCSTQLKTFIAQHMIEHNGPLFICWLWVGPLPTSSGFLPWTYGLPDSSAGTKDRVTVGAKEKDGEDLMDETTHISYFASPWKIWWGEKCLIRNFNHFWCLILMVSSENAKRHRTRDVCFRYIDYYLGFYISIYLFACGLFWVYPKSSTLICCLVYFKPICS